MTRLVRSAKAVVLSGEGRALLLRRSETHPYAAFQPDLPGGVIEASESFEAGIARELTEEVGINISKQKAKLALLYAATRHEHDESVTRLLFAVKLAEKTPVIQLSWEHDHYQWVDILELKGIEEPYQAGIEYTHRYKLWQTVDF